MPYVIRTPFGYYKAHGNKSWRSVDDPMLATPFPTSDAAMMARPKDAAGEPIGHVVLQKPTKTKR